MLGDILKKDVDDLMAVMDSDFFGCGGAQDEVVVGLPELCSQLQRDFAQRGDLFMEFGPLKIAREGNVAWGAGDCIISPEVTQDDKD